MGLQLHLFHAKMDEGKERRMSPKELKMFNKGVAVAQRSLKAAAAQLRNGGKGLRGISRNEGTQSDVSDCFP